MCESRDPKNSTLLYSVTAGEDQILSAVSNSHIFEPLVQSKEYIFLSDDAKNTASFNTAAELRTGFVICLSHLIDPSDWLKQYIP
ncbi:MAG: hypothetical protein M3129_06175, partial [Thermoproteota archaeon]|nr:hypothetical protein [Thermoproteota archaeon]